MKNMKIYKSIVWVIFIFLNFISSSQTLSESDVLSIKIVEDIDNNWTNNFGNQIQAKPTLEANVKAANFSGPPHFKTLFGKCFEKVTTSYKYVFCPFHNVTQHEISLQWKPYNGILGIWQEWEITDNKFTAMLMKDGDKCGSIYRSARVVFTCSNKNQLNDVSEPEVCHYLLLFETPLVCQTQTMFVYPYLSTKLRDAWDEIEGELLREEITKKGYQKELRKLLTSAGFLITNETKTSLVKKATEKLGDADKANDKFDSLEKCSSEYARLQAEMEGLRTLISLTARSNHLERQRKTEIAAGKKETNRHSTSLFHKLRKKKN